MLQRRSKVGIIGFSDDEFREDDIRYCPHCLEYNSKIPLTSRIYPVGEPVPIDKDNWKQCIDCGTIYPIYEIQKESQIKDVVGTTDNPFDESKDFLGIDSRRGLKNKKRKDDFDFTDDEDLKRELRKGSILLSYSEDMPSP